jgi:hypothetical protein
VTRAEFLMNKSTSSTYSTPAVLWVVLDMAVVKCWFRLTPLRRQPVRPQQVGATAIVLFHCQQSITIVDCEQLNNIQSSGQWNSEQLNGVEDISTTLLLFGATNPMPLCVDLIVLDKFDKSICYGYSVVSSETID